MNCNLNLFLFIVNCFPFNRLKPFVLAHFVLEIVSNLNLIFAFRRRLLVCNLENIS